MKIVIAMDSYKGTLTSVQASEAIKEGIKCCYKGAKHSAEIEIFPMADGGEGTLEAVMHFNCDVKLINVTAKDSLSRDTNAFFLMMRNKGKKCAVIEMAGIAGITMLKKEELNVMKATTFGVGQLIRKALDEKVDEIYLGIGGSATNDAGLGMLTALGAKFMDRCGRQIRPGAQDIGIIENINLSSFDKRIHHTKFVSICDVKNPFYGPLGATYIYGPQKGVSSEQAVEIDKMFQKFADIVYNKTGKHLQNIKGSGAGGGIGGAAAIFLNSEMMSGADWLINYSGIEKSIANAEIIITGEGRTDSQTFFDKLVVRIGAICKKYDKKAIAISGHRTIDSNALRDHAIKHVYAITDYFDLQRAMCEASYCLSLTSKMIFRELLK